VGTERVDLAAAAERGIVVTNTPGANASSVADLTRGFLFALARHIAAAKRAVQRSSWPRVEGVGVGGKRLGLVGMGAIGKEVAVRASALGCTVVAHDPLLDQASADLRHVTRAVLDEVIATADFVSLHVPSNPDTRGMVSASFLRAMKPGAFLINTVRGDLVDEEAMADAIGGGHLAGAALDTLSCEPPQKSHVLLGLENVLVTPHMGAHSDEAVGGMSRMAAADCLGVLDGRPPRFPVNRGRKT